MLRLSTYQQFRASEQNIANRQRELFATQQQVSSGKRIDGPADDPAGAADAASIRSSLARFEQFKSNQDHASYLLGLGESVLKSVVDGMQDAQEKLVAAGNGALGDSERKMLATELEGVLGRLVGLANSSDGAGGYLFAGTAPSAAPFTQSGNSVSYAGDQTAQRLEIAQGRLQQVKVPGDAIFNRMRAGNGEFTTAVGATNTGGAWIDAGSVIDPSATQDRPYAVNFTVDASGPRFAVVRTNADATTTIVASGNYTSPAAIQFDGVRVNITGTPANGDSFSLQPAGSQSMFDSLAQAIDALRQPAGTDGVSRAQLRTALAGTQASMTGALDHVLIKQAEMGAGLQELQAYGDLNEDRSIEYQSRLSSVEDLDYAKATAELARQQIGYQAALQSYSMVSKMSLFDFL
jgi:flagellar hook-associated protein 3 FlgL